MSDKQIDSAPDLNLGDTSPFAAEASATSTAAAEFENDKLFVASQYKLMWWKFRKHKMAMFGASVMLVLYFIAIFVEFLAPYGSLERNTAFRNAPPQRIRIFHDGGLHRPFVYGLSLERDPVTWRNVFTIDETQVYPIRLFVRGSDYRFWGLFRGNLRLFGLDDGNKVFLFGTDSFGRDLFSRVLYGARISLTVGLLGVILSFFLGLIIGGLSGYLGGITDVIIQRIIEFLRSIPTIPLWLTLAAAIPASWSAVQVYFAITLILALVNWTGLARIVRSKLMSIKNEDFVIAAKVNGGRDMYIIVKHLIPSFLSFVIVSLTLQVPGMILAETALSYLGLGLTPPIVSWGVLLSEAQNVQIIAMTPWLLIPGIWVIATVLAFNFIGDGLRDAADPYSR